MNRSNWQEVSVTWNPTRLAMNHNEEILFQDNLSSKDGPRLFDSCQK